MSNQSRQRFMLQFIKNLSAENGLLDPEKERYHCYLEGHKGTVFKKIHEVETWLDEHEGDFTIVDFSTAMKNIKGIAKTIRENLEDKSYGYAELEEVVLDELVSSKIEKLKRLAEGTPYKDEADAANLKIRELREKYEEII